MAIRHRPSAIDKFLSAHPEHTETVRAIMVDGGLEVDEQFARVTALGCKTSRSAVGRFRKRFVRRQPGPAAHARIRALELLSRLSDEQLAQAVAALEQIR